MSFREKVSTIRQSETKLDSSMKDSVMESRMDSRKESSMKESRMEESKPEPKYMVLGFLCHGGYGKEAQPYQANEHASISLETYNSDPKLMTFMSCTPGNSLIGEDGGTDNIKLSNYFEHHGNENLLDVSNFPLQSSKKEYNKLLANIFLNYVGTALKEKLEVNPRERIEKYKKLNPTDIDVCRNSYICDGKVGISNRFQNKAFDTNDKSTFTTRERSWGIYIYNNNCGVKPLTNIENIPEIAKLAIMNKNGQLDGYTFNLVDIIEGLTDAFELTNKDYLFLFDYSCSNFGKKSINPTNDPKLLRRLARSVTSDLGFGRKSTKRKRKPTFNKGLKKTRRKTRRKITKKKERQKRRHKYN